MVKVLQASSFHDMITICELTEKMVVETVHGNHADFDKEETLKNTMHFVLNPKQFGCFLCDGGFILGKMVKPYYTGKREFVTEFGWYAGHRGGRELLEALAEWGKSRGAYGISMSVMEADDPVKVRAFNRVFRDLGYLPVEHSYFRAFDFGGQNERVQRASSVGSGKRRH